jgi:predicted HAD superfamily phosphohydrolase
LRIARITPGSEIISIVQELGYITPLLIVCIALKYLPNAFKTVSESVKNLSEAHKNIRETRYMIPAQVRKLDSESLKDRATASLVPYEAEKLHQEALKFDEERKTLILNRKKLESELRQDEMLKGVDEKHLKQIPQLLKDLLSKERNDIAKARSFAIKNVKDVKIRKKKRDE